MGAGTGTDWDLHCPSSRRLRACVIHVKF